MVKSVLAAIGTGVVIKGMFNAAAQRFKENLVIIPVKPKPLFHKMDDDILVIQLPLLITNNNPFQITFSSFKGVGYYGQRLLDAQGNEIPNSGLELGDIFVSQLVPVAQGETGFVTIEIEFSIRDVVEDVYFMFASGSFVLTNSVWIYGYINILGDTISGGIDYPIAQPIPIIQP